MGAGQHQNVSWGRGGHAKDADSWKAERSSLLERHQVEMQELQQKLLAQEDSVAGHEDLKKKHKALVNTLKKERDEAAASRTKLEAERMFLVGEVKHMMGEVAVAQKAAGTQSEREKSGGAGLSRGGFLLPPEVVAGEGERGDGKRRGSTGQIERLMQAREFGSMLQQEGSDRTSAGKVLGGKSTAPKIPRKKTVRKS